MKFALVAGFIAFDVITGLLYAVKRKKWKSSIMREGLFHKMALIIFIALAVFCDYGQQFLDLGFKLPITNAVLVYISIMEIGSCKENLDKLNPEIKGFIIKPTKEE